jgi:hypothetical protein
MWVSNQPLDPQATLGGRRAGGPGRRGGGDPGADGGQAQGPGWADPGHQPGPGADRDRAGGSAGPVHPAHRRPAGGRPGGPAAPARRRARLRHRVALRELGRRARFPDAQTGHLDELIVPLVTGRAPGLPALYGAGAGTAALLLIAAGDHPERLRPEAARAHLCGVAPIPASSGTVTRWRLNRGGDREASHALRRIVITRMSSHPATRAYVARRSKEDLSQKEIIRCLKRYVAREACPFLRLPR